MAYESQAVAASPESEPESKTKRQVSYNPDAVLCPACKKRIRLNNNGRIRVHMAGKMGSDHCMGSNTEPLASLAELTQVSNEVDSGKQSIPDVFQKEEPPAPALFSDAGR